MRRPLLQPGARHGSGNARPVRAGLLGACQWLLLACSGEQSALDPRGPVAEAIATTWWVMFWGALVIFALVMATLCYAVFRRPEARPELAQTPLLVGAGLVFPIVVLTALLVYGTGVGRSITEESDEPLVIEITGHQWWWDVRYPAAGDAPEVRTANELRLPAGVPVEFVIRSADVVHSFWIPNLGGKVDMIPGRTNTLRLIAGEPGRFRAQCSEFCGAGHARMGFVAIAEPPAEFAAWRARRARAASVTDASGLATFLQQGCAGCHAIDGTEAAGSGGPPLTHVADRPTLGASAAGNSPEELRTWLADHGRTLKPGSLGPEPRESDPGTVEVLARFLEALQ